MLLFHAKGAVDFAVLFLAVPERAVVDLEVVARPGPPTGELARRCLHGAIMARNGIFRYSAQRILPTAKRDPRRRHSPPEQGCPSAGVRVRQAQAVFLASG